MANDTKGKSGKGKAAFGGKQAPPFGKKGDQDKAEDEKKTAKAQQRKTKKGGRAR